MRRYLTPAEAESALGRGKQVEQFLGGFLDGNDRAIRYAIIRSSGDRLVANVYECFEPEHPHFYDVTEFQNVEPDEDPEDFYFDSLEEAVEFLVERHGATRDKFVNQGMVCEEYKDFQAAER